MSVWRPLDTAPRVKRNGDTDWTIMYAGGYMQAERVAFESSYRLQSGARQQYTMANGLRPWRFRYVCDEMPARFADKLFTLFDWAKGTYTTAPQLLLFQPGVRDLPNTIPVGATYYVHLVDDRMQPIAKRTKTQRSLSYSVSITFEEATPTS